jgi:hypothetical protein
MRQGLLSQAVVVLVRAGKELDAHAEPQRQPASAQPVPVDPPPPEGRGPSLRGVASRRQLVHAAPRGSSLFVTRTHERHCVRTVSHATRNPAQTRSVTGTRSRASMLRKSLNRKCVAGIWCASARATGVDFQARPRPSRRPLGPVRRAQTAGHVSRISLEMIRGRRLWLAPPRSHQRSRLGLPLSVDLTDRWCDVPEMSAFSTPKPSQPALRCGRFHALCVGGIALRARRNPTPF